MVLVLVCNNDWRGNTIRIVCNSFGNSMFAHAY